MSERQRIPKLDIHSAGVFKRGLGWMVTDTGDDEIAILFQCPHNHRATIMNHSINAIGEVNASVLCYANCGYHEFVVLDEWPAGWSKPAGAPFVAGAKSEVME
jgi:hypothetical protein